MNWVALVVAIVLGFYAGMIVRRYIKRREQIKDGILKRCKCGKLLKQWEVKDHVC